MFTYTIKGEPLPFASSSGKTFYIEGRTKAIVSLENQHDDRPLFSTPISIEIEFGMRDSASMLSIVKYVHFVESIATGVLFKNMKVVKRLRASSIDVSENPYTHIVISHLEEE